MKTIDKTTFASLAFATAMASSALAQDAELDMKFAGALEFSNDGTLFVGDNFTVYSFSLTPAVINIDVTISSC